MNPENKKIYDVIIIGAGPAGLTAAIYACRAELSVAVIEAGMPGGKVALTSEVENWPGRKTISGPDLAMEMYEHAMELGPDYILDSVEELKDAGETKLVVGGNGEYRGRSVIIASGTIERHLGIPGEKELYGMGVSYCAVCDGAFFRGKDVVVVGGGNSAVEDAVYLTRFADKVTLITRRDVCRADRTNQKRLLENEKIDWLKKYRPVEILSEDDVVSGIRLESAEDGHERVIPCSAVFPMVGLDANTSFIRQEDMLNDEGFILAREDMSTAIPGVYAAGDVRAKGLRQIVTATGDGSIAAQSVVRYLEMLDEKA